MDGWRDSEEAARRGLELGRRLVMDDLITGAVLATVRIALIVWGSQHQAEFANWGVYWVTYPEELLYLNSDFRLTGLIRRTALFVVGSCVVATPVLAAGGLLRRPRLGRQVAMDYLSCGTALAIARIVVLVLVNDMTNARWYIPWVLYPRPCS